jgi:hypothetical protein
MPMWKIYGRIWSISSAWYFYIYKYILSIYILKAEYTLDGIPKVK